VDDLGTGELVAAILAGGAEHVAGAERAEELEQRDAADEVERDLDRWLAGG
jgi:hypothetical protein